MIPGFTDLLSVFFIKVSSRNCVLQIVYSNSQAAAYELVQQNSVRSPSYWYDFAYDSPQKHLYNVFFLGSTPSGGLVTLRSLGHQVLTSPGRPTARRSPTSLT